MVLLFFDFFSCAFALLRVVLQGLGRTVNEFVHFFLFALMAMIIIIMPLMMRTEMRIMAGMRMI